VKKKFDIDNRELWVRCEAATGLWLESLHDLSQVTWVNGRPNPTEANVAEKVKRREGAPLIALNDEKVRSPDFKVNVAEGRVEYWEVKQRAAAWRDAADGVSCFWIARDVFDDYLTLAKGGSNVDAVWLIVYEGNYLSGTWFKIEVRQVEHIARHRRFVFPNDDTGEEEVVDAILWPVHEMIELAVSLRPQLKVAAEMIGAALPLKSQVAMESVDRLVERGDLDSQIELDILRRQIGMESFPRYSLLYGHSKGRDPEDLHRVLGLLEFGIRVFLITDDADWRLAYRGQPKKLDALIGASLLEVSEVREVSAACRGVLQIDGFSTQRGRSREFQSLWQEAESRGVINTLQYAIVHARDVGREIDAAGPIAVVASAGSGKTETLTERIIFLLTTSSRSEAEPIEDRVPIYDLRLDEIVLITFTRESAREMRQRLNRTLVLRRRLCGKCVMPVLAWLTQLGSTNISTIHSYAKKLIQTLGPIVGVAHDFAVATDHDRFDEALRAAVDEAFHILSEQDRKDLPEAHEVREFVHQVWEALVRNGINVLNLRDRPSEIEALDWASDVCQSAWGKRFGALLPRLILHISTRYRQVCREQGLIPTDQLISIAADLLRRRPSQLDDLRVPRYMFIDEFQDTDGQQIEMALSLQSRGTQLFVVGDPKQGIYRFRGAEGNAFRLLERLCLVPVRRFGLVRNFRTDGRLLEDMQNLFDRWSAAEKLEMTSNERLVAAHDRDGIGSPMVTKAADSPRGKTRDEALAFMSEQIRQWMREDWYTLSKSDDRIAVLCRSNWQAMQVKRHLNDLKPSVSCKISKGGDFFRSRAVSELRALLRALTRPRDIGAVLELMETAWGHAVYAYVEVDDPTKPGEGLRRYVAADAIKNRWTTKIGDEGLLSWGKRLTKPDVDRLFSGDLDVLSARLESLSRAMENVPVLELLAEIDLILEPRLRLESAGIVEPERYQRNLDHAFVLIDDAFRDGTVSIWQLNEWLDLKASTDYETEEPDLVGKADVLAITVHKAKGREFDAVLIPFTDSAFVSDSRTSVSILGSGEHRRVGWRWWRGQGKSGLFLETNIDAQYEQRDNSETVKEETRLLYVAMTRAKSKLAIFVDNAGSIDRPKRWADLL